jgi:hypothetical protein
VARVYSTLFFDLELNPGLTNVYAVPVDRVAVLVDVCCTNVGVLPAELLLVDVTNNTNWRELRMLGFTGASAQWRGRQVYPPGHVMGVDLVGNIAFARGSGYLLTLP